MAPDYARVSGVDYSVPVCGNCRGESCKNRVKVKDVENEEELERKIFDVFN